MNFAISTIEIMLANLMYRFDWKLPAGSMNVDMTVIWGDRASFFFLATD